MEIAEYVANVAILSYQANLWQSPALTALTSTWTGCLVILTVSSPASCWASSRMSLTCDSLYDSCDSLYDSSDGGC